MRLLYIGEAAMVLAPISAFDVEISRTFKSLREGKNSPFLDFANELGGPAAIVVPAGAFAASLITRNARFQDAAFTSLQSVVYAQMMVFALKTILGRSRPEDTPDDAHTFRPFTDPNSAFPSGHAAMAFAWITPWAFYYPHAITYGFVGLAVGTAAARVERQKHWFTDILAGSAIGFATAAWLSRKHLGHSSQQVSIEPTIGLRSASLAVRYTF
jgi:membrane-associated phospholipid phosphatase